MPLTKDERDQSVRLFTAIDDVIRDSNAPDTVRDAALATLNTYYPKPLSNRVVPVAPAASVKV